MHNEPVSTARVTPRGLRNALQPNISARYISTSGRLWRSRFSEGLSPQPKLGEQVARWTLDAARVAV